MYVFNAQGPANHLSEKITNQQSKKVKKWTNQHPDLGNQSEIEGLTQRSVCTVYKPNPFNIFTFADQRFHWKLYHCVIKLVTFSFGYFLFVTMSTLKKATILLTRLRKERESDTQRGMDESREKKTASSGTSEASAPPQSSVRSRYFLRGKKPEDKASKPTSQPSKDPSPSPPSKIATQPPSQEVPTFSKPTEPQSQEVSSFSKPTPPHASCLTTKQKEPVTEPSSEEEWTLERQEGKEHPHFLF